MSKQSPSNPPEPDRREGSRAEQTRAAIIEQSAAAFAEHGFHGTSLNRIIRESGLSKGAFYFHFGSKEDLALAVFRAKQAELVSRIREDAAGAPDALAQLAALLRARARLLRDEPAFRGFLRLASDLGVVYGPGSEYARSYGVATTVFADLVERGQKEGILRADLKPWEAGEGIFAILLGADELSKMLSGGADLVERTEKLLDLIIASLAAPDRRPPKTKQNPARRKRK